MLRVGKWWTILFKILLLLLSVLWAFPIFAYDKEQLDSIKKKLSTYDIVMPEPEVNDWLATNKEEGQTLEQYLQEDFKLSPQAKYIYIQPIGKFTKSDRRILSKIAKYIEIFYGFKTKIKADISSELILDEGRRINPMQRNIQFSAPYIIENLLDSRKPVDAAAYVGFTATDLWPGNDWNFVFGLASPDDGMGVWSLARMRSVPLGSEDNKLLLRAAKLATHEIGHIFGLMHNKDLKGLMNGSNHMQETDATPLYLSSEYLPKLLTFIDLDIKQRYENLAKWCIENGFEKESFEFQKRLELFKD